MVLAAASAQAQDSRIVLAANIWRKTDQNGDCVVVVAEHYGSLNRGNKGTSSAGGSHSLGTTPKEGEQQEEAAEMGVGIRRKRRRKEDWPNQANPILPPSSSVFMLFRLECPTVLLSFRGKGEGAEWAFLCKEGGDIPTPPLRTLVRSLAEGGDSFDQKGKSCSCETVLWGKNCWHILKVKTCSHARPFTEDICAIFAVKSVSTRELPHTADFTCKHATEGQVHDV